jgi:hypothetical protein
VTRPAAQRCITVEGATVTAMIQGGELVLTDEKGETSTVTIVEKPVLAGD